FLDQARRGAIEDGAVLRQDAHVGACRGVLGAVVDHHHLGRLGVALSVTDHAVAGVEQIGVTHLRSVLDGAMTRRAITSSLGRRYWRMLRWHSSTSSSMRIPDSRSTSTAAHRQNVKYSRSTTLMILPDAHSRTRTLS